MLKKFYKKWWVHNIIAHPLMQLVSLFDVGLSKKTHDCTLPVTAMTGSDVRTWAELKVDCYDGENQKNHKKYWEAQTDGDMQSEILYDLIDLHARHYPLGTVLTVEVPFCPECYEPSDVCHCGFDWYKWEEEKYS